MRHNDGVKSGEECELFMEMSLKIKWRRQWNLVAVLGEKFTMWKIIVERKIDKKNQRKTTRDDVEWKIQLISPTH